MGIGKGKSDKIDIDGLIGGIDNESKILQVEHGLTENIAELKQTTAALNAAIDRMESIVSKFNASIQEMQTKKIDAQVHPQTLSNPKIFEQHLYELCCGSRSATYGSS